MAYVDKRGPLFDGRAIKAANDAAQDIEKTVATLGASIVRTELNSVLRTQTPYYRMKVNAEPSRPGWRIHDSKVIYGPWLEGTGSRNYPVTRFKGYATFRRMTQVIQARANAIADGIVAKYMGRM
jgi:hypothetical protein